MSDTSQGDGWWQASDDKWYPPEDRPESRPAPPVTLGIVGDDSTVPGRGGLDAPPTPTDIKPEAAESTSPRRNILIFAATGSVLLLIIAGVAIGSGSSSSTPRPASHESSTSTTLAPENSCSLNLAMWVYFTDAYFDTALGDLDVTFGAQSTAAQWIVQAVGTYRLNERESGQGAADAFLNSHTLSECINLEGDGYQVGLIPMPPTSPGDPPPTFSGGPGSTGTTVPWSSTTTTTTTGPAPGFATPTSSGAACSGADLLAILKSSSSFTSQATPQYVASMTATASPTCAEGYAALEFSSPQGDSGDAVFIDTGGQWQYVGDIKTECGAQGSTPELPSSVCSALQG